ncbi:9402_t:CDS:1 [Funneliformis mosseae]|uniref:9402_t:CDS:1 n=1 Tax=Funneliformis mosseae TaxID=27381 RepID=A0A9N9ADT3_FUNMO|nr:9402_t:CDS:1 [Funneliformis mosseae]
MSRLLLIADGRIICSKLPRTSLIKFQARCLAFTLSQDRKNIAKLDESTFSIIQKKHYSTESFNKVFKYCKNITQLENAVNRLFYKHHTPHPQTIREAFKACSRLIIQEHNKSPLNNFSVNSLSKDMSKYWIDVPSKTHTTDDVIRVANGMIERLDQNCKTTYVYNSYILVCGIAKRTDLAYAAYNEMLKTFVTLNVSTYKLLIFACANKLDLDRAFHTIDSSIDSIFFSVRTRVWVKTFMHLGVGALVAKCIIFALATVVQDINGLTMAGIGMGAFLSMRYAMHAIFKDVVVSENSIYDEKEHSDIDDTNLSSNLKLSEMRPKEIKRYMYTFLISCLLRNEKFDEALIVFHQMADNHIPLDIISYNDLINSLCRMQNPTVALEAVIKFQEHGFRPTAQTFQHIVLSLKNRNCDERMRKTLYNLMRDNNVFFPDNCINKF